MEVSFNRFIFYHIVLLFLPLQVFSMEDHPSFQLKNDLRGTELRTSETRIRSILISPEETQFNTRLNRLRDTRIFQNLHFDGEARELKIKEKWTSIPIFKTGGGGGVSFLTLGIYDPNSFGQVLEFGGQYTHLAGQDSGVLWFRNPFLFSKNILLGIDVWTDKRLRLLYDSGLSKAASAFILDRKRFHTFLEYQISRNSFFGMGIDITEDRLINDKFDTNLKNNISNFFSENILDENRQKNWLEAYYRIGRFNEQVPRPKGFFAKYILRLNDRNHSDIFIDHRYFHEFGQYLLGLRGLFEASNSPFPEDQIYLGGLDRLRGFNDGQIRTSSALTTNLELRRDLGELLNKTFEIQAVFHFDNSFSSSIENPYNSTGIGLRFLSQKVYRLNARIDYSSAINGPRGNSLSFGLQQFF